MAAAPTAMEQAAASKAMEMALRDALVFMLRPLVPRLSFTEAGHAMPGAGDGARIHAIRMPTSHPFIHSYIKCSNERRS